MKRILRIGMDVHSTNYTLCAMEPVIGEDDRVFANIQVTPDYKNVLMFIENLKTKLGLDNDVEDKGYQELQKLLELIEERYGKMMGEFIG